MFYQLTYRIQDINNNFGLDLNKCIKLFDYNYVQQLSWTSGHFILDSYDNNIIRTLVAFPHVVKPDRELVLIQEYILDRLGLDYETTYLAKWIQNREDDNHDEDVLEPNNLIIRSYHQDYFFKRILEIALKEKSPRIASVFYSNYYLDKSFFHNLEIDIETFIEIESDVASLIERFESVYIQKKDKELPIFIVNEQNKLVFEFLRYLIIKAVKSDFKIELDKSYKTQVINDYICSEFDNLYSIPFSNSILGQIWDISFEYLQHKPEITKDMLINSLIPVINNNHLHTLIIIRNIKIMPIWRYLIDNTFVII